MATLEQLRKLEQGSKLPNSENFKRIIATSRPDNEPSLRILQRLDFKHWACRSCVQKGLNFSHFEH